MSVDGAATDAEAATLRRLERLARLMDSAVPLPGTNWRVGADAIVGLVPGVGDGATALVSAYLITEAWRLGIPRWTLARMLGNLAVDLAIGSVPLVGDVFDVGFKANRRNITLLHEALRWKRE